MQEITRNVANVFSFYAIIAIEHCFFNALTFAGSLARCWKPRPSHGTWRMLMHEKPCLNPIIFHIFILLLLNIFSTVAAFPVSTITYHSHVIPYDQSKARRPYVMPYWLIKGLEILLITHWPMKISVHTLLTYQNLSKREHNEKVNKKVDKKIMHSQKLAGTVNVFRSVQFSGVHFDCPSCFH